MSIPDGSQDPQRHLQADSNPYGVPGDPNILPPAQDQLNDQLLQTENILAGQGLIDSLPAAANSTSAETTVVSTEESLDETQEDKFRRELIISNINEIPNRTTGEIERHGFEINKVIINGQEERDNIYEVNVFHRWNGKEAMDAIKNIEGKKILLINVSESDGSNSSIADIIFFFGQQAVVGKLKDVLIIGRQYKADMAMNAAKHLPGLNGIAKDHVFGSLDDAIDNLQ